MKGLVLFLNYLLSHELMAADLYSQCLLLWMAKLVLSVPALPFPPLSFLLPLSMPGAVQLV